MSIKFNVIPKKNPSDETAIPKHYAIAKSVGKRDLRNIAEKIARRTTLERVDVIATLEAMLDVIPEELTDGYIVEMGEFGGFYTSVHSNPADTKEEFHAGLIKKAKVSFRPGRLFKNVMKNVQFEKIAETTPATEEV
ncbi:MAG: HU family DNA-binding protein [Bacteroidales bacterium]|nr:HU family DNA-binding protein [Bacteroidales bacterium]